MKRVVQADFNPRTKDYCQIYDIDVDKYPSNQEEADAISATS